MFATIWHNDTVFECQSSYITRSYTNIGFISLNTNVLGFMLLTSDILTSISTLDLERLSGLNVLGLLSRCWHGASHLWCSHSAPPHLCCTTSWWDSPGWKRRPLVVAACLVVFLQNCVLQMYSSASHLRVVTLPQGLMLTEPFSPQRPMQICFGSRQDLTCRCSKYPVRHSNHFYNHNVHF